MTYKEIVERIENILKSASEMAEATKMYPKSLFEGIYPEILEFINRQQEQLEAAIAGQETLQKALAEKEKEIERLNKEVDRLSQYVLYNEEYINDHYWDFCSIAGCERVSNDCWKTCPYSRYSKVKSKIIKEFAEMLKKECLIDRGYEILYEGTIDNLVKEMTEVDE